jgi:hypothetical protein
VVLGGVSGRRFNGKGPPSDKAERPLSRGLLYFPTWGTEGSRARRTVQK